MVDGGAPRAKTTRAVNELISALSTTFKPGDLLPSIQALTEQFGASHTVVRAALHQMRDDGLIVTENGVGSRMCNTAPAHVLTRTADNPLAHVNPSAPAQQERGEASEALARLFDVRKGAILFTLRQAGCNSITLTRIHTVRIIPAASLYDLDPRPDPYGDRTKIIDRFAEQYGSLETYQRTRTIPEPTPDIRAALKIKPGVTVDAAAIATRTVRSGRLLMTETEYTVADPTVEWETRLH